ncbi:ATP-binding protein [Streptomyces sp. NPDC017260]|uniref:ATP-binding protein n=1 Tax=unclassified Streptomyces TaxID=2593676 RepID=UPI00379B591D
MHTEQHARSDVVVEKFFPCTPDQVGCARKWAASIYAAAGADPDVCRLLVSEVATNAVVHAQGEEFCVRVHRRDLWVEVVDQSWKLPRHRPTTEKLEDGTVAPAEHGRGLELLDLLAPGYKVLLRDGGKAVRFRPLAMDS